MSTHEGERPRWRGIAAKVTTVLACLLVLFALVVPYDLERFSLEELAKLPIEGILGVGLLLLLPGRARKIGAILGGAVLGGLLLLKIMDAGFDLVLYRPFDLVLDWPLFKPAVDFLDVTVGKGAAVGAVIAAIVLALGVIALVTVSVVRITKVASRRHVLATRTVRVLGIVWLVCAILGVPVASQSAAALAYSHATQVRDGIKDQEEFAKEAAIDAYRDTPGNELLQSLRGKDVVVTFVESYGRNAIDDPGVSATLTQGTARLKAKGYESRSGLLTSPTAGGGSWMAQATLLSGLWIDNQQRYRNLTTSDRLTLNGAFKRANWQTAGVYPGITQAWPEGNFFGYNEIYTANDLGYRGPRFSYATMPDQYTLSALQKQVRDKQQGPIMAAVPMVSSHAPWSPIPQHVDWKDVGDGTIFNPMAGNGAPPESIFGRDPQQVRADYAKSIQYSVDNLVSYVEEYGDDDLVLVFLGDHQPASIVTGEGASHDVPITIVARDPKVMERVSSWGWNDGIKPGPQAPVWKMSDFRDRFISAFSDKRRD
ncbi:hypothetical protein Lesp02_32140 [Lentzea sp. NBRC 105346]|uniref:sulfatase-like hydrolase/transferase n=1 Tax=Lentzea sp. NBRC 105346 TaxID=3032205 RepID=UPI0024A390DA|nr:sulfatase-like hydrolase/transferase [Lentzea sp. NBRC 105346]GLZ31025.1 hypothetical protein Lesp02_32140 [Lentzea sp. NBRC 105346]